jgi:transposase-like protein
MTTGSRQKFTPEFRAEAVVLAEAAGGNIAKQLGPTTRRWGMGCFKLASKAQAPERGGARGDP